MRLNARLDEEVGQQVEYLTAATGHTVSQVVREAIARYSRDLKAKPKGLRHFAQAIGQGRSGRSDIASNYKQLLGESLDAKYGVRPK